MGGMIFLVYTIIHSLSTWDKKNLKAFLDALANQSNISYFLSDNFI